MATEFFQGIWTELQTTFNNDTPLQNFLGKKIVFGNVEETIDSFPAMYVEPKTIEETFVSVPDQKRAGIAFEIRGKIREEDQTAPDQLVLKCYEFYELVGNAVENSTNHTLNNKALSFDLSLDSMNKIGDKDREVVIQLIINSQTFSQGDR